jgi:hypothetical protein
MENLTDMIAWLFVAANASRLLGYLPQVVAAWKCRNGASAVSRMTWGYFAFAHFTGVLYGLVVIHDLSMAAVFLGNFLVCVALLAIVTWKKRRHGHSAKMHYGMDAANSRFQPTLQPDRRKTARTVPVEVRDTAPRSA